MSNQQMTVVGEVSINEIASQLIQTTQVSNFTVFTFHTNSSTQVVDYLRKKLQRDGEVN